MMLNANLQSTTVVLFTEKKYYFTLSR